MSKTKGFKKAVEKMAVTSNRVRTHIPAQMAAPGPPLGSQLGAAGINIANFVKDFNLRTSIFGKGVPIPCDISVNPDRSYNLIMSHPPFPYLIKMAAGVSRGAMNKEVVGMITRKHVYEIALLKSSDPIYQMVDLQVICDKIITIAYDMGIKVVDKIDPEEYSLFLINARKVAQEQLEELKAKREAKLLRA